jgi:pimeloyl-ACP methyl ester carboxylesterase
MQAVSSVRRLPLPPDTDPVHTPPRRTFTAPDGAKIAVVVDDFTDPWTAAPWLVLIHAAMGTLNRFHGWVPHLARRYRIVRADVRGHGGSEPGEIGRIDHERLARYRFDERLPQIRYPALMVASDGDPRYAVSEYESVCAAIPGCRLIVYPGLRHNIASQAPDACARDLRAFPDGLG